MSTRILNKYPIAKGIQRVELSDGTTRYLSCNYAWHEKFRSEDLIKRRKIRVKSGIQAECLNPGEFMDTMKRTNVNGREVIYWDPWTIPEGLGEEEAKKIQNLKDFIFKESMDSYRADKISGDISLGTEVYEFDENSDYREIIIKKWKDAYEKAYNQVKSIHPKIGKKKGIVKRGSQERQVEEVKNGISLYKFVGIESVPGTGKTVISYLAINELGEEISKIRVYLTDTINNTIEAMYKYYLYCQMEGNVLSHPMVVCSANERDGRLRATGCPAYTVSNGENENLKRELEKAKKLAEEGISSYIFATYQSSEGLFKIMDSLEGFPKAHVTKDEVDQISGKLLESNVCAAYRYKHLFSSGLEMTGTLETRPDGFNDLGVVYNGDLEYGGRIVSYLTETEARFTGQISDQKVLIYPAPINNKLRESITKNKNVKVLLGKDKKGNEVSVSGKASLILVARALKAAISIFDKRHIHLPFSRREDARKAYRMLKVMQERGIIDNKYKLFLGFLEGGNKTLDDFKNSDYGIVLGTRWMTRGTDTENCDCQIYTYIPKKESASAQLKGRTHRPHKSKDYSLIILIDFEDNISDNPMYKIIEKDMNGRGYSIIGEEVFIDDIDLSGSTGSGEENLDLTGGRNNLRENIGQNELFLMSGIEKNPEYSLVWENLANAISHNEYTDSEGKSLFKQIANKHMRTGIQKAEEKMKSFLQGIPCFNGIKYVSCTDLIEAIGGYRFFYFVEIPQDVKLISLSGSNSDHRKNFREYKRTIIELNGLGGVWENREKFIKSFNDISLYESQFRGENLVGIGVEFLGSGDLKGIIEKIKEKFPADTIYYSLDVEEKISENNFGLDSKRCQIKRHIPKIIREMVKNKYQILNWQDYYAYVMERAQLDFNDYIDLEDNNFFGVPYINHKLGIKVLEEKSNVYFLPDFFKKSYSLKVKDLFSSFDSTVIKGGRRDDAKEFREKVVLKAINDLGIEDYEEFLAKIKELVSSDKFSTLKEAFTDRSTKPLWNSTFKKIKGEEYYSKYQKNLSKKRAKKKKEEESKSEVQVFKNQIFSEAEKILDGLDPRFNVVIEVNSALYYFFSKFCPLIEVPKKGEKGYSLEENPSFNPSLLPHELKNEGIYKSPKTALITFLNWKGIKKLESIFPKYLGEESLIDLCRKNNLGNDRQFSLYRKSNPEVKSKYPHPSNLESNYGTSIKKKMYSE